MDAPFISEQDQDNADGDDDDEVFDYLSPTGLRRKTPAQEHSLMTPDDSTLSCYSNLGTCSSVQVTPDPFIEDIVSCDIGELFAPESPVITVSLSRQESLETIHVLDIEDNKGYDTDSLFEDDSGTITVSLSSSSTLNQLSKAITPSKVEQDVALGASRPSTVARLPPGTSSSNLTLDFVDRFMSIYCKDQSVDRSLWSSIHAPSKTGHVAQQQPLHCTLSGAPRVHL